jgi:hypothetical protein
MGEAILIHLSYIFLFIATMLLLACQYFLSRNELFSASTACAFASFFVASAAVARIFE